MALSSPKSSEEEKIPCLIEFRLTFVSLLETVGQWPRVPQLEQSPGRWRAVLSRRSSSQVGLKAIFNYAEE